MSNTIASVAELYIYPVKSMAGIAVDQAHVGLDGILGDRQYSFVRADQAAHNSFPWMTARESARMLRHKPQFTQPPTPDEPEPPVEVRTPEGGVHQADDPAFCKELAGKVGRPLFLLKSGRGIFDCQHISLFSLTSVRGLATEAGCPIDRRQFRANVYLEPASGKAFDEESWSPSMLQIGEGVLIGVTQRSLHDGESRPGEWGPKPPGAEDDRTTTPGSGRDLRQRRPARSGSGGRSNPVDIKALRPKADLLSLT